MEKFEDKLYDFLTDDGEPNILCYILCLTMVLPMFIYIIRIFKRFILWNF